MSFRPDPASFPAHPVLARQILDPLPAMIGQTDSLPPEFAARFFDPTGRLASYALIDAARVMDLGPMLVRSGLAYQCLFTGKARSELRDVAPWLVRLEPENEFCRRLFYLPDAAGDGGGLAGPEAVLFLLAPLDIEGLWRHFRRITRVRTESGSWIFFRFYDPSVFPWLADCLTHQNAVHLLPPGGRAVVWRADGWTMAVSRK